MATITLSYSQISPSVLVTEKVNQDLPWYDLVKKEMVILHGGRLDFEYKEDPYLVKMGKAEREKRGIKSTFRLLPKAVDVEIKKTQRKNDKEEIKKWLDSYFNYNDTKIAIEEEYEEGITLDVPSEEVENFTYECERKGFFVNSNKEHG